MKHFARGGNLTDFEPEDWRNAFEETYQKKLKAEQNNFPEERKTATKEVKAQATLLRQKQQLLKEELEEVQAALNKLKNKKARKSFWQRLPLPQFSRKWIIGMGVLLLLFGLWTFRAAFLPEAVNQTIDDSVATLDSLQHEMGIDSLIHDVAVEMDSLVSDVAAEMDTLVSNVASEMDTLVNEVTTELDSLSTEDNTQ